MPSQDSCSPEIWTRETARDHAETPAPSHTHTYTQSMRRPNQNLGCCYSTESAFAMHSDLSRCSPTCLFESQNGKSKIYGDAFLASLLTLQIAKLGSRVPQWENVKPSMSIAMCRLACHFSQSLSDPPALSSVSVASRYQKCACESATPPRFLDSQHQQQ